MKCGYPDPWIILLICSAIRPSDIHRMIHVVHCVPALPHTWYTMYRPSHTHTVHRVPALLHTHGTPCTGPPTHTRYTVYWPSHTHVVHRVPALPHSRGTPCTGPATHTRYTVYRPCYTHTRYTVYRPCMPLVTDAEQAVPAPLPHSRSIVSSET